LEKLPIAAFTEAPIEKSAPGERAGTAPNVNDAALRGFEHWPKQAAHPHASKKFQGVAVHPGFVWQIDEIAGASCAR
jgi:hypothetical protein